MWTPDQWSFQHEPLTMAMFRIQWSTEYSRHVSACTCLLITNNFHHLPFRMWLLLHQLYKFLFWTSETGQARCAATSLFRFHHRHRHRHRCGVYSFFNTIHRSWVNFETWIMLLIKGLRFMREKCYYEIVNKIVFFFISTRKFIALFMVKYFWFRDGKSILMCSPILLNYGQALRMLAGTSFKPNASSYILFAVIKLQSAHEFHRL